MNLPRLILADESRPGKIPAGVIIACALKEMGYRLKLFVGGVDEATMRTLQVLCGLPVTMLDPIMCESQANFRWLFQTAASPDCINLVLTNLGARWSEDSPFRMPRECLLLGEWLDCEVVPIVYSDTSSVITVRTISEIIKQLENGGVGVHGVLFRSVLSHREYELLERELGRHAVAFPIGSLPKMIERDMPLLVDLVSDNASQAVFSIRSAAMQLKAMERQICWPVFSALGQAAVNWIPQAARERPITDSGKINIAVIRHPALTLGGNGTELFLKTMGCNVVDIPIEGEIRHNVPIHGVYIPHGLGYMTLQRFFRNLYLKTMINRGTTGSSFLFAEGGAAPILGAKMTLPPGYSGGGDARGFGVLPFNSLYTSSTLGPAHKMLARRRKQNPLISGSEELVWGYTSSSLKLEGENDGDACWSLAESFEGKAVAADGWAKGRVFATCMRLEPWGSPAGFRRWLEG